MVSFKIGFEVTGETLFGLLAKFLPVDNLSVEEVPPKTEARVQPVAKLAHLKAVKPVKPVKPQRAKRKSRGLNLSDGINGLIMGILHDGHPHRAADLEDPLKAKGYSGNSVGSRLQSLRQHGIVEQVGEGKWRLAEKHVARERVEA